VTRFRPFDARQPRIFRGADVDAAVEIGLAEGRTLWRVTIYDGDTGEFIGEQLFTDESWAIAFAKKCAEVSP
jgi:hypothetical protein